MQLQLQKNEVTMGQSSSGDSRVLMEWRADVQRQATSIKDLALMSYEDFVGAVKELNKISQTFIDANGKRLIFAVKRGTDSSLLWKATVKVGCVRVDVESKQIDSYRLLNLRQFLQVYKMISIQMNAQKRSFMTECQHETQSNASDTVLDSLGNDLSSPCGTPFTTSVILERVAGCNLEDQHYSLDECCICMERKPEVILPCAHNYCLPCIEQWNDNNKTCPVCREEVESTDDSWVISEAPDSSEMAAEVQKLLSGLSEIQ